MLFNVFLFVPFSSVDKRIAIAPFPKENKYIKIDNYNIVYYAKTKQGIQSRELKINKKIDKVERNYVLDDGKTPYIFYNEKANILGMSLFRDNYKVYLPKE